MSTASDLAVRRAAFLTMAKKPRWVYTHICANCHHPAHEHTLAHDADLIEGSYICEECGCEQPQNGAFVALSTQQYKAWQRLGEPS